MRGHGIVWPAAEPPISEVKGFTSCVFQGYGGPLSGKMEQKTDQELVDGHYHKHCLTITFNEGTPVSGSDIESVGRRASAARSNF